MPETSLVKQTPANSELLVVVEQSGLEKTEAQKFLVLFTPYLERMSEIEVKIKGLNKENPQKEDISIARGIRLALKNNRVASEKVKDDSKAAILIKGRLIDNLNSIIKNISKGLEAECEKIEKDAEFKEAARLEALRSHRAELLSPYVDDPSSLPLGTMTVESFDTMFSGYKLVKQQREEAAAKAEAERLEREAAEKLEQERIRRENEVLKKEAESRLLEKERAEAETVRLQKELKSRQDAEIAEQSRKAKESADKLAAEKKAAKAPVKEKMRIAIMNLDLVLPESEITPEILINLEKFKTWALKKIEIL